MEDPLTSLQDSADRIGSGFRCYLESVLCLIFVLMERGDDKMMRCHENCGTDDTALGVHGEVELLEY